MANEKKLESKFVKQGDYSGKDVSQIQNAVNKLAKEGLSLDSGDLKSLANAARWAARRVSCGPIQLIGVGSLANLSGSFSEIADQTTELLPSCPLDCMRRALKIVLGHSTCKTSCVLNKTCLKTV